MSNPGPYAKTPRVGIQAVTTTPVQIVGPQTNERVVEALLASDAAFQWSHGAGGPWRSVPLNAQTSQYEKRFPVLDVFSKIWIKAAGSQNIEWEALLNAVV